MNFLKRHIDEIALAGFVVVTRWLYRSEVLTTWDSLQFALATIQFDLGNHQPHPPGYVFYVYFGKWLNMLVGDLNLSFVLLGILASVGIALLTYRIGMMFFRSRSSAFILTLLMLSNPVIWFYGEIALTYIFDALFALLFFFLGLKILKHRKPQYLLLFSFFLGLSGGFRPSLILLFAVFWVVIVAIALWKKMINPKYFIASLLAGAIGVALWFFPLIHLSGGLDAYLSMNADQASVASAGTSIFAGAPKQAIYAQLEKLGLVTLIGLNGSIFLGIAGLLTARRIKKVGLITLLIGVWVIPSLFVFGFVHFGQPGYVLTIMPALILYCFALFQFFSKRFPKLAAGLLALVLLGQFVTFLFMPQIQATPFWPRLRAHSWITSYWTQYFSAKNVLETSNKYQDIKETLRSYNPSETVILNGMGFQCGPNEDQSCGENYLRFLQYYLPEYTVLALYGDRDEYFVVRDREIVYRSYEPAVSIPSKTAKLIFVTDVLNANVYNGPIEQISKQVYAIDVSDLSESYFAGYALEK